MSKMYEKQCIKLQTEFAKKEERILEKVEEVNKLRDIAISDNEKLAIIVNLKEEKQTDLNHEFQNKLDEKDKMITALQDRIQNYLYDVNGDPWCKKVDNLNKREEKESITGTNNISMNEIQTINSQSVPNDEAYNQKRDEKEEGVSSRNEYDILFLHDSICNDIDMRRLIAGCKRNGEKQATYTIEETSSFISQISYVQSLILHIGINNLKSQPAEEVFTQFVDLVNQALEKCDKLVISLPTPARSRYLNSRVNSLNNLIKTKLERSERISFCFNSNFCLNGEAIDQLFYNNTKLSREHGIKLLAGNLRRALFPEVRSRQYDNIHKPTSRPYHERPYSYSSNEQPLRQERNYPNEYQRNTSYNRPNPEDNQLHLPYNRKHSQLFEPDNLAGKIASAIKEAFRL